MAAHGDEEEINEDPLPAALEFLITVNEILSISFDVAALCSGSCRIYAGTITITAKYCKNSEAAFEIQQSNRIGC